LSSHGRLLIDSGGMAGGKTLNLITRTRKLEWSGANGDLYICVKPREAVKRDGSDIVSRFGGDQGSIIKLPALNYDDKEPFRVIDHLESMPDGKLVKVVIFNEMHMWDAPLLGATIDELLSRSVRVFGDVLKLDAGGFPFEIVNYLLARDAEIDWHYGQCTHPSGCSEDGTHSQLYHLVVKKSDGEELERKLAPYGGSAIQAGDESGSVTIDSDVPGTKVVVDYQPRCLDHFLNPPLVEGFEGNLVRPIPRFYEAQRRRALSTYAFQELVAEVRRRTP
jgi:thymidine kinase